MRIIIFLIPLFWVQGTSAQTRIITGKIIDNRLDPGALVGIFNADTTLLKYADLSGNFKIEIPVGTTSLIFGGVGMEWAKIEFGLDCTNLEIIILLRANYDFISLAEVDRLRKREFNKLPAVRRSAFQKGLFTSDKPCFTQKFIPIK